MAKKEVQTDLMVSKLLENANIKADAQGSNILEIENALKTASKKGTNKCGFPEYVAIIKDFLIVIEDKADLNKHIKKNDNNVISMEVKDVQSYAVNGALYYAKHLVNNTSYKKVFCFGVSGDEKSYTITPLYVEKSEIYRELPNVDSFIYFNEKNIEDYYKHHVLKEFTNIEKDTTEILKDARQLHEDLRNYGNLKDIDKPLIVSGILLALNEIQYKGFNISDLNNDSIETDGEKIYKALKQNLKRSNVSPESKKDKILSQFSIIKDTPIINQKNETLGKTPLRYYTEFIYENIFKAIKYSLSAEDYIGRFYGEFMSYSGGDGQTLGIILTPKHITELFCDLADLKITDVVLDPCCGTAGFLIASMHNMFEQIIKEKGLKNKSEVDNDPDILRIKQNQMHGIEIQPYMFTVATTNMILRGDGKSNILNEDFFKIEPNKLQLASPTVGMMNPPYSQGSVNNPELYEISFTKRLLDSLTKGAKCLVIIPQSAVTGKSNDEKNIKSDILKKHTLEGVITLNTNTFYGVGTNPVIAIFTAGIPHNSNKICKFIDFRDDGYVVLKHVGLVETERAKDRKQYLLDVWFDRMESSTKFCVKSTVNADDEWLHSYFYFNDEIPADEEFEKTVGDYLNFEFNMIMKNRKNIFIGEEQNDETF